jgi:hypothetical protein
MSKLVFNPLSGNFDTVYDQAEEIKYSPSTPANWQTIPTTVEEGLDQTKLEIAATQDLIKEPTGFQNRTDTTITFDFATREFSIAPVGGSFDVYVKGKLFTKTSTQTVTITDDSGNHYIYFDIDGVLTSNVSFDPSLFENNAFVSIIYWNADTQRDAYFADERHGLVMDGATHAYLHTVFGARYLSGLALQNFFPDGSGDLDKEAQFEADIGSIRDEDILIELPLTTEVPVLYRMGVNGLWNKNPATPFPVIYNGQAGYTENRLAFNPFDAGEWKFREVKDGSFVLVHIFATNDTKTPYVAILGTNEYLNVPAARAAAETEISSISGLPFAEFVAVGTVIFQTDNSYGNTPKARIVSAAVGETYVDFRGEQLYTPSGVATSHSLLSNLSSDDHPQYFNEARGDARYAITASNLGTGEDVFAQKTGTTLELKSIKAGTNITLSSDANEITISSTDTGEVNTASNVGTGAGVFSQKTGVDLEFKSLVAGSGITITPSSTELSISSVAAAGVAVKDEGTTIVPTVAAIDFIGDGVNVTTDGVGTALVTISGGSLSVQSVNVTPYGIITPGDVYLVDASSSPITITLPLVSSATKIITIKKIDSSQNVVTINGNNGLIDGNSDVYIYDQYVFLRFVTDGTKWSLV